MLETRTPNMNSDEKVLDVLDRTEHTDSQIKNKLPQEYICPIINTDVFSRTGDPKSGPTAQTTSRTSKLINMKLKSNIPSTEQSIKLLERFIAADPTAQTARNRRLSKEPDNIFDGLERVPSKTNDLLPHCAVSKELKQRTNRYSTNITRNQQELDCIYSGVKHHGYMDTTESRRHSVRLSVDVKTTQKTINKVIRDDRLKTSDIGENLESEIDTVSNVKTSKKNGIMDNNEYENTTLFTQDRNKKQSENSGLKEDSNVFQVFLQLIKEDDSISKAYLNACYQVHGNIEEKYFHPSDKSSKKPVPLWDRVPVNEYEAKIIEKEKKWEFARRAASSYHRVAPTEKSKMTGAPTRQAKYNQERISVLNILKKKDS